MKLTVRVVFSEYTSILLLHRIVHVFLPLRFKMLVMFEILFLCNRRHASYFKCEALYETISSNKRNKQTNKQNN